MCPPNVIILFIYFYKTNKNITIELVYSFILILQGRGGPAILRRHWQGRRYYRLLFEEL